MNDSESRIGGGRKRRPAAAGVAVVGVVLIVAMVVGCGRTHRGARDLRRQRSTRPSATLLWTSPSLPGAVSGGSFGPDGERLAVVVGPRPTGHPDWPSPTTLWLVDAKHAAPLAGTEGAISADWSPAGGLVAFLAVRSSRPPADRAGPDGWDIGVFVFDVEARQARRVALPDGDHLYGPPGWSPDSTRLACGQATEGPQGVQAAAAIIDVARETARTYPLPPSTVTALGPPAWDAAGRAVLVRASAVHGTGRQATHWQEIWLVEASTGRTRRVYARLGTMPIADLAVGSPDGTPRFALWGILGSSEGAVLLRAGVEGSEPAEIARLTAPAGWELRIPHISPDGHGMAAMAFPASDGHGALQGGRLLWAHDGRVESVAGPQGSHGAVVAWSGDGRRIAISYRDQNGSRIAVYQMASRQ